MISVGGRQGSHSHATGQGFIDYNDSATSVTPITLAADTWTTLTNDGLGAFTNTNYIPSGITSLMSTPAGTIDISELDLGDSIIVRNDYTVTPSANNQILQFRYVLGTGAGEYTLEKMIGRLDVGSGVPERFSLTPDYIYVGDANTRDNPITMQIKTSGTGTVVNSGSVIQVINR